jgi:hypothetical protein
LSLPQLYEETLKENQLLKSRLSAMEEQISDLRVKLERSTLVSHRKKTGNHSTAHQPNQHEQNEKFVLLFCVFVFLDPTYQS